MVKENEETPLLRVRPPDGKCGEEISVSRPSGAKANIDDTTAGRGSRSSRVGFASMLGARDGNASPLSRMLVAAAAGAGVLLLAVGLMSTLSASGRAGDTSLSATAAMPSSAVSISTTSPSGEDGAAASREGALAHVHGDDRGRNPAGLGSAGGGSPGGPRREGGSKGARIGWRHTRDRSSEVLTTNGEDVNGKAAALGGGGGGGGGGGMGSTSSSKPNVFFFLIDDMGYGDIGYQSTDLSELTPNLDALAAGGVKLTSYYTMTLCTPARASIMTGRYPIRYGLQYGVIVPGMPYGLPLNEKILPEYMNEVGYESHMVGKWHLGSHVEDALPSRRGFETYLGYLNGVQDYYSHKNPEISLNGKYFFDFGFGNSTGYYDVTRPEGGACSVSEPPTGGNAGGQEAMESWELGGQECLAGRYSTDAFVGRAREIVRSKSPVDEQPLFLYLAHQAVHSPTGPAPADEFTPEELAKMDAVAASTGSASRVQFAGVLQLLDKRIGAFVDMLEQEGWLENSVIIVASDNGACPEDGGSNYPLRGTKQSPFEGGTKVPAFIWSESHLPSEVWGSEYNNLMHSTDWLPTIATMTGFEISGSAGALDGVSHWEFIKSNGVGEGGEVSKESPRTEILHNWDAYVLSSWAGFKVENRALAQGAFRSGDWKLLTNTWCSGYYSHDPDVIEGDELLDPSITCEGTGECMDCADYCQNDPGLYGVTGVRLYNIRDDPREEHDLSDQFPEIARRLHERAEEVVYSDYAESGILPVNNQSKLIFREHDWWLLPWVEELEQWETQQKLNGFM